MKQQSVNNGIKNVKVLIADEGKDLYCTFNEQNMGKKCWLGYVYYGKDNKLLKKPRMLKSSDFIEIDEVSKTSNEPEDLINN